MTRSAASVHSMANAIVQEAVLRVSGAVQRRSVTALWSALPASLASVRTIDLSGVTVLDTAGLAWLIEVAARVQRCGAPTPQIVHAPVGYASLCMAYRIHPSLEGVVDVAA